MKELASDYLAALGLAKHSKSQIPGQNFVCLGCQLPWRISDLRLTNRYSMTLVKSLTWVVTPLQGIGCDTERFGIDPRQSISLIAIFFFFNWVGCIVKCVMQCTQERTWNSIINLITFVSISTLVSISIPMPFDDRPKYVWGGNNKKTKSWEPTGKVIRTCCKVVWVKYKLNATFLFPPSRATGCWVGHAMVQRYPLAWWGEKINKYIFNVHRMFYHYLAVCLSDIA